MINKSYCVQNINNSHDITFFSTYVITFMNYLIIFTANNTIANNMAEENILDDKTYSINNITNDDNENPKENFKNNHDECSMLNTDIRKNNDIDNKQNSDMKNDTFNNITDMINFCNKRSYFSHSSCICDITFNDKNVNRNDTYKKNDSNDNSLCDICALNRSHLINNKTPDIIDQTIDNLINDEIPNILDQTIDIYNINFENDADKNKYINEDNKSEKNFENSFNTIDDNKSKIVIILSINM